MGWALATYVRPVHVASIPVGALQERLQARATGVGGSGA